MTDAMNAEALGETDDAGVVGGGDAPLDQPHADVRCAAANDTGDGGGASEPPDEISNLHDEDTLPTELTDYKQRRANRVDALPQDFHPIAVGLRLRLFRHAFAMGSMGEASKRIGVIRTRWNNWEAGVALPPVVFMQRLRLIYADLCLNYLYLGSMRTVPGHVAVLLQREVDRYNAEQANKPPG
ncbi:MAG: helix-turn-helix transcriptional regulator [Pseudomonadota bacterium]